MTKKWPKPCPNCGGSIYAREWAALSFVGFQDDGDNGRLELRNHGCGTTLAVATSPTGLTDTLRRELAAVFRNEANENEMDQLIRSLTEAERETMPSEDEATSDAARLHGIADALLGIGGERDD